MDKAIGIVLISLAVHSNGAQQDYFPRIPDIPSNEDSGLILVAKNVSDAEKSAMDSDDVGPSLSRADLAFDDDTQPSLNAGARILEGKYFEGDITGVSLTRIDAEDPGFNTSSLAKSIYKNAIVHTYQMWPNAEVPYVVSRYFTSSERAAIRKAIEAFELHSCIRWRPRSVNDDNYVHFLRDDGCYSRVGKSGGPQVLSLDHGCFDTGTIIHEMLHAVGFWHEQSRPDRDSHVQIRWGNIRPGKEDNFARYQRGEVTTLELPYDVSSVMHYDSKAFSRNGHKTIVARENPKAKLGQRNGFTQMDIQKLNKLYKCPETSCDDILRDDICETLSRAEQGCQTFSGFLRKYCAKTCQFCMPTTDKDGKTCQDNDDRCAKWLTFGNSAGEICKTYADFMRKSCPYSCGFCNSFSSKRPTSDDNTDFIVVDTELEGGSNGGRIVGGQVQLSLVVLFILPSLQSV